MTNQIEFLESATFTVGPCDHRCRHWCKIVDASALPNPGNVNGASDLPGGFTRDGDVEIFPEQYVIEGEERHHRKTRGWTYNAYRVGSREGEPVYVNISADNASVREKIKTNPGLTADDRKRLLSGSGELAAVIRACHVDAMSIGWIATAE